MKALRHELYSAVIGPLVSREELLSSRDIQGDVGRDSDSERTSEIGADEIAFRNLRRVAEAVRVLEEVAHSRAVAEAARRLREVRYAVYSIEKALTTGDSADNRRSRLADASIYLLATQALTLRPLEDVVGECLEAGVDVVQLREKASGGSKLVRVARRLRELTAAAGALLIVNDRPDVALLCDADGVHVGQDDLSVADVRRIVGSESLIGVSTHSRDDAVRAVADGADYIGVGPMFPTKTKDAGPLFGPDGLREVLDAVDLPAFPIGGISPANVAEVALAGRVAVSSAVLSAANPAAVVRELRVAISR